MTAPLEGHCRPLRGRRGPNRSLWRPNLGSRPHTQGVQRAPKRPDSPKVRESQKPRQIILKVTVERHGNTRDLAIVLILRHTGIRVSELASLTLGDVEISERKGALAVRSGKG